MRGLRAETERHFDGVTARFETADERVRAVELGVAKLEGLLEGLRDAITVRVVRPPVKGVRTRTPENVYVRWCDHSGGGLLLWVAILWQRTRWFCLGQGSSISMRGITYR